MNRRQFLNAAGAASLSSLNAAPAVPSYLRGFEKQYTANPRAAALEWFRQARFGLFIHYGLYALEGRHEWSSFASSRR